MLRSEEFEEVGVEIVCVTTVSLPPPPLRCRRREYGFERIDDCAEFREAWSDLEQTDAFLRRDNTWRWLYRNKGVDDVSTKRKLPNFQRQLNASNETRRRAETQTL